MRRWLPVKLLVTGGAGYVGSVVAATLLEQGHTVRILDNLTRGHVKQIPLGSEFLQGDLSPASLSTAVTPDLDAVLHIAALSLVGESMIAPEPYWRTNVGGTQNLLEAMRRADVPRLVFSSTAAVYGTPDHVPIDEQTPPNPTNPFGASKVAAEQMITGYCHAYGMGAYSLRHVNVAGAHGALGERHDPETHLIPNVLRAVANPSTPVTVFGTDWPTLDGTCVRDYVHVTDLTRAHALAVDACRANTHEIVNIGSGSGYSVRQVIAMVEAVTGKPVAVIEGGRRPGEPAVFVASHVRATELLGWQPALSLQEMVADAWSFMRGGATT
jgi:UDP-glucose 4-epimerase